MVKIGMNSLNLCLKQTTAQQTEEAMELNGCLSEFADYFNTNYHANAVYTEEFAKQVKHRLRHIYHRVSAIHA